MTTPTLGLDTMPANSLEPSIPFNNSMQALDALVDTVVESAALTADPTTSIGDIGKCWIPAATATGDWAGHETEIAVCTAANIWRFLEPKEGKIVFDKNTGVLLQFLSGAWAPYGAGLTPASIAVQYVSDTGSTADSDPGAGLLKWNNATQGSATQIYLDDDTADGVSMTGFWAALDAGGFAYLQHATDQDTWQIWEITAVTDATGYVKLSVSLLANGGSFSDADPMLITL